MTFSIRKFINTFGANYGQEAEFRVELSADGSGRYVEMVGLEAGGSIDIGTVDQGTGGSSAWKVTATALPLPTNAAQETGGNLATLAGAVTASKFQATVATALPAGSNVIGHVIADTGSTTAVTALPALPAGSNVIGHVIADTGSTTAVTSLPALAAGQNNVGNVGNKTVAVTVTPTVTITNSYGTNFVVGGLLTFNNAFTSTGSGMLMGVCVTIAKVETSGFTFFPFNANPTNTTWTDASVAAINALDVAKVRGAVSLAASSQLGTHTVAYAEAIGEPLAPAATTLYGVLIANAALTNQFATTSDVTVTVKILQDV